MVKYIIPFLLTGWSAWSQNPLQPTRITGQIVLDGQLTERSWDEAAPWSDFIQCFPRIGNRPSESTWVRVLYDDEFLYIGITANDSVPTRIIATGLERDVYYSSDDHLCVLLDTYNDKRQGVLFATNALSARFDEEVLDNGNGFNAAFNTFWNVRSARTETGYSSEFQIPFSTLRFQASSQVTMGFKVIRQIKHRNEYVIFPSSDANIANAVWRVNNAAEMVFTDLKTKRPFYLFPYVKVDYQQSKQWNDQTGVEKTSEWLHRNNFSSHAGLDKAISNLGVDLKYGLSKNFTLDATLNTDFAQAETDNRIFNFTRFAINLPEKRNFFLESKDYLGFSTGSGMLLFNSRAIGLEKGHIVPIIGGVRVSGKANGLQLGLLDLQSNGIAGLDIDPQHFSVMRLRKEIWGNGSFVGGIFTNRISTRGDTYNNQAIAFDAVKRFKDNKWTVAVNVGATNNGAGWLRKSSMANLELSRVAAVGYNHLLSIEHVETNFKPQIAFAPDSAYVLLNTNNGYVWKWKDSPRRNLYWLTHNLNYKYRTVNETHESLYTELELGTSYRNGVNLIAAPFVGREYMPYDWNFRKDIIIPSAYYLYRGLRARFDSPQTGLLNYSLTGQFNEFYSGMRLNLIMNGYYAFNRNFRVTYKYEFNDFRFPEHHSASGNARFQSHLVTAGIAYTHSIYFSAKALLQYDDVSRTIGSNFRIRINPREGTDFYLVYNPRVNTAFYSERRNNTSVDQQTLIIKFSKAITW